MEGRFTSATRQSWVCGPGLPLSVWEALQMTLKLSFLIFKMGVTQHSGGSS